MQHGDEGEQRGGEPDRMLPIDRCLLSESVAMQHHVNSLLL